MSESSMKVISIKEEQFWIIKDRMSKLKISKYHKYISHLLDLEEMVLHKNNTDKEDNGNKIISKHTDEKIKAYMPQEEIEEESKKNIKAYLEVDKGNCTFETCTIHEKMNDEDSKDCIESSGTADADGDYIRRYGELSLTHPKI